MKLIPLSNSTKKVLIDDSDYERVSLLNWWLIINDGGLEYASGWYEDRPVRMHRWIMPGHPVLDHRDGNGLNNLRSNLRPCTTGQNAANKRKQSTPTKSKYKGVIPPKKPGNSWAAVLIINGVWQYRGKIKTEIEAARAYNEMAIEHFGEFARLNPV